MANAREILDRMKSIQDTMKITNAMYMISSSKLKKAKASLDETEPYFYSMQMAIGRILRHVPDMKSEFFNQRPEIKPEDRKVGYIVVTADKGLAGSYNHNIFKDVEECLKNNSHAKLFVVGEMGRHYFEKKGLEIAHQFHYTAQNPSVSRARNITEKILEEYLNKELDEVVIIYTKMLNGVQTETETRHLLPLEKEHFNKNVPVGVQMEQLAMVPSAEALMENIIPIYIQGFVYGALVESYASEHNLRMLAMQSATDSASAMLNDLSIQYNRVRQAAITQEITEVVSGAKAQKTSGHPSPLTSPDPPPGGGAGHGYFEALRGQGAGVPHPQASDLQGGAVLQPGGRPPGPGGGRRAGGAAEGEWMLRLQPTASLFCAPRTRAMHSGRECCSWRRTDNNRHCQQL